MLLHRHMAYCAAIRLGVRCGKPHVARRRVTHEQIDIYGRRIDLLFRGPPNGSRSVIRSCESTGSKSIGVA